MIFKQYRSCAPWGLFILRIVVGIVFIAHGWGKLQAIDGVITFFGMLGLSAFWAYLVAWIEVIGGIAMILGIFTRIAGYLLAIILLVAIWKVKLAVGLISTTPVPGYELDLTLLAASLAIALAGPGVFALGRALCGCCKSDRCRGWKCPCHYFCGSTQCGTCQCGCGAYCGGMTCDNCASCAGGKCTGHEMMGDKCDNCADCNGKCTNHEKGCDNCEDCKGVCTNHEMKK